MAAFSESIKGIPILQGGEDVNYYSKPWLWVSFNYDLFWIMLFGLIGSGVLVGAIGSYLEYKFTHWMA